MKFERTGDIKESMGIGRNSNAIDLLGIECTLNSSSVVITEQYTHSFLAGLERGEVRWTLIELCLPMTLLPLHKDDKLSLKFVLINSDYVDGDGNPINAGIGLDQLRKCGRDIVYKGVLYAISDAGRALLTE